MTNPRFICANCASAWSEDQLIPLVDIAERVLPGEVMPAGECPGCSDVCHEDDSEDQCAMSTLTLAHAEAMLEASSLVSGVAHTAHRQIARCVEGTSFHRTMTARARHADAVADLVTQVAQAVAVLTGRPILP